MPAVQGLQGWPGHVAGTQTGGVTTLALAAGRFLELLLTESFPGLRYSRRMELWVAERFSTGSVLRLGDLGQWERGRKRLFSLLDSSGVLCSLGSHKEETELIL